jgi:hypothetical protein
MGYMPHGRLQHAHLWTGGLSFGGVVVAHVLAYWLAVPDGADRHGLLAATGHRYWGLVVAVAFAATVSALCRFTIGVLQKDEGGSPGHGVKTVAAGLVLWQAPGLLVLEGIERLTVDGHVHPLSLVTEPPVVLGLVVQLFVAVAGAVLVLGWARAVSVLVRRRPPLSGRRKSKWPPSVGLQPEGRPPVGARTCRGPPLPS